MKKFVLICFVLLVVGCGGDDDGGGMMADPCMGVICQNGGTCNGGDCACALEYTGTNCQNERIPAALFVDEVRFTQFPATEANGEPWDILSPLPDLTFQIRRGATTIIYEADGFYEDAAQGFTYSFPVDVSLPNPTTTDYSILLFDLDLTDADDLMSSLIGRFYETGNAFPSTITLTSNFNTMIVELEVRYGF